MYRIRFFTTMLACLFSKPQGLLETFKVSFIATPLLDTDVTRLFTQTYSQFMGICRWHFVFKSNFRKVALKKMWVPVTTAEMMDYKKSIKAFQRVHVETKLIHWNSKRFYLSQTFIVKGRICGQAYLEGLIRGPQGHLSPPEVFAEIGLDMDSPALPAPIEGWVQSRQ